MRNIRLHRAPPLPPAHRDFPPRLVVVACVVVALVLALAWKVMEGVRS